MREKDKKRLSFVKIYNSEKYHPNHKKYKFTKKKLLINKQKISNMFAEGAFLVDRKKLLVRLTGYIMGYCSRLLMKATWAQKRVFLLL